LASAGNLSPASMAGLTRDLSSGERFMKPVLTARF
jgi:hypothetical protein